MTHWNRINSEHYEERIQQLYNLMQEADGIVVGTGAGMSAAGGFTYHGPRFEENFKAFIDEYGFLDMLHAALYNFPTWQTYWAFESKFILLNYFNTNPLITYQQLSTLLKDKNYFILTTNADNRYRFNDYDMDRIFQMQGEYGKMQCSKQCHNTLYEDEALMWQMVDEQENLLIPQDLIPYCPKCQAPLEMNKRDAVRGMVEDDQFARQRFKYEQFLKDHEDKKLLFLEIGVGFTTPQYIKRPFQQWVKAHPKTQYVTLNQRNYALDPQIKERTSWLKEDIQAILADLVMINERS
ncbi:deacetylase SIR2 [Dolosicoccus paucivorans]|uniref:Deacetylase SIR2 n=1 Tax=Dolosicoccus paucivorans TaxID=84521 RepID=A0A2N6SNI9_9LACT|nr:deacetylase SIR2 [Dolosicoccus paucivorans]PMB83734.1 deacetylase SIR2 [Dolosicoccus paucivorans]PMC58648.1 deacetylase SIR2 [Dolosicoccus paucivorans]